MKSPNAWPEGKKMKTFADMGWATPQISKHGYHPELCLLKSLLIDPSRVRVVKLILGQSGKHFAMPHCGEIYEDILELAQQGVLCSESLGCKYINEDTQEKRLMFWELESLYSLTGLNVEFYSKKVLEASKTRAQQKLGEILKNDPMADCVAYIESLKEFDPPETDNCVLDIHGLEEIGTRSVERMIELKGKPEGMPTGLNILDGIIHGWNPGDMIIIAARPSVGKTAFALNAMLAVAKQGYPALMFSCEMQPKQIAERCFGILASTRIECLRQDVHVSQELAKVKQAQSIMRGFKGFGYDSDLILSVPKIQTRARAHVEQHGESLIIVDYVQRVRLGEKTNSIREEIVGVSGALQSLAKELKSPLIVLSQIGRSGDDAPKMANMKESGSLEEDADVVIILDKLTDARLESAIKFYNVTDAKIKKSLIGIEIAKNRHGPTDKMISIFNKEIQRFSAITNRYQEVSYPPRVPEIAWRDHTESKTAQDMFESPGYDDGDEDVPF